jgi:adenosine deaminase
MRLYARQTLEYLARYGVLYAELRSAVSGYASKGKEGMTYQEACTKFQAAFGAEQEELMSAYRRAISKCAEANAPDQAEDMQGWSWCTRAESGDSWSRVFGNVRSSEAFEWRFPAKVNLIFTGKRHKATREMLMEAAAGVMLNSESSSEFIPASNFTSENMTRCRVVGFDLAGLEESFPPEMFRAQFEQLSRMHIPITAHAVENASARFVDSAVLDLRARRLGHGLALADDEKLMARVREERICIEICPVSNYQTNEFAPAKPGREYPLKEFLDSGDIVCLNTDNPIVSYTNIIKEFLQASYAYGDKGISLWDALLMIRMGFAHAFKGLAERRALIELVEQMIFDLLIDPDVEDLLRGEAEAARSTQRSP